MNKFLFLSFFVLCIKSYSQEKPSWTILKDTNNSSYEKRTTNDHLKKSLLYTLDEKEFKEPLLAIKDKNEMIKIAFPNSNGELEEFKVKESSNFAPELQEQYPEIRSYSGLGITDPNATVSFSISPNGIQTMVLRGGNNTEYIDPLEENKSIYIVSNSRNKNKDLLSLQCKTLNFKQSEDLTKKSTQIKTNTGVFKTMRLALSCTGEYANYFGGTVAGALAGMNATMTRVNAVFNRDLALKLEIIANTDLIIYTNANTDPYSNKADGLKTISNCTGDCPGTWNKEVQNTITNIIGEGNYDIGHLFAASGGGGDAGCIGCVCSAITNTNSTPSFKTGKGSAYTSPADSNPEGSSFDIDYVAHEMGHQLGANHTFSYDVEGTGVSVEPGSGSTIMGYAGVTDYDIQNHSDDYFAYASIMQIQDNLASKNCPVNTTLSNQTPTVKAGLDYVIPKSTPFILTGEGTDPNGNIVTYCWEQNDSATNTETEEKSFSYETKLHGPLFRSILPSISPIRYMPELSKVLAGQLSTSWESPSAVARTLNFTLTGRNNAPLGLGQTQTDAMMVTVDSNVGPFTITSQNNPDTNWTIGTKETINWTVNNTDILSGSTHVNIKLSTDGGLTFPTVLASNTPNDGSEQITVPDISATHCRILIEPTANIYYAVNAISFPITNTVLTSCSSYVFSTPFTIPESETYSALTIDVPANKENITGVKVEIKLVHPYLPDVQIELINPQGTVVKLFDNFCGASNNTLFLNYDDSGIALSCTKTTFQTVVPAQPLSVFNNGNPTGKWTLRVRDAIPGDTGIIESASLSICTKSTPLATPNFEVYNFDLSPNPSKGSFNVRFTSNSSNDIIVSVHDLMGRQIFNRSYRNESIFNKNIQLNNVQTGIYLLKIKDGDQETSKKIVIE